MPPSNPRYTLRMLTAVVKAVLAEQNVAVARIDLGVRLWLRFRHELGLQDGVRECTVAMGTCVVQVQAGRDGADISLWTAE